MHNYLASLKKLFVAAVLAVLTLSLSACSGTGDEVLVREMVSNTMDMFKSADSAEFANLVDEGTMAKLKEFGLDPTEFFSHLYKHLEYEIGEVKVDGSTADVNMTITNIDISAALTAAGERFDEFIKTDEATTVFTEDGEQGLVKKLYEYLYEIIDSGDVQTVSSDVVLHCVKGDDGWDAADTGNEAFFNAIYGGADVSSYI